jgi:hypothetical protein
VTVGQDRQYTYNVTLRRSRSTIVAVEKQWILQNLSVYIFNFSYSAWNAQEPYCHLWPTQLGDTFATLYHKLHDFRGGGGTYRTQNVFWFSLQHLSETFLIVGRIVRDLTNDKQSSRKYLLLLSSFNETRILSTYFQEILKYQISRKSVQWEPSCYVWKNGRKGRYDEANSRYSQPCESA